MLTVEFIVENYLSGVRIDSFLSRHLRNYTTWRLHRMVTCGMARINDVPAERTDRVFSGQRVQIRLAEPPDKLFSQYQCALSIVYEDPWLIVVDKQPGLVAHPVGEFQEETLSNALQYYLDQQTPIRGLIRPGVVHRLDRMTSGLIVAAKEHLTHRLLSIDFQCGKLSKRYLALIEGSPDFQTRQIDLPIGQYPGTNSVLMSARPEARDARQARTRVDVVERFSGYTLVHCQLFSGRNHQIRVHLAHIGHPVIGDEFYGPWGIIRPTGSDVGDPDRNRHALHAAALGFFHPILRTWMSFETGPPADFWELAETYRNSG